MARVTVGRLRTAAFTSTSIVKICVICEIPQQLTLSDDKICVICEIHFRIPLPIPWLPCTAQEASRRSA